MTAPQPYGILVAERAAPIWAPPVRRGIKMKRVFSGIAASLFAAVFCLAGCTADPAREPVQEPLQPGGPVAEVTADPPRGEEGGLHGMLV